MAENTNIEWADHTFNPWQGCTKVSPGCDHCYAEARQDKRLHVVQWGPGQPRKRTKTWGDPVKWNKAHAEFFAEHGRRQRVFCASLADVFDNEVPPQWRVDLFRLIADTPNLDWLLLTKRIGNAAAMIEQAVAGVLSARQPTKTPIWPWPNVWLGATIVNQEEADRDIPKLLATPARVRFLSMEPLLGPVDVRRFLGEQCREGSVPHWSGDPDRTMACPRCGGAELVGGCSGVDWVIVGGESGPGARPTHPDWVRSLRDQCKAAGVPFLFKQWGEWAPWARIPEDTSRLLKVSDSHRWPIHPGEQAGGVWSYRVGKKAAGRLLDGLTHDGYPEVRP